MCSNSGGSINHQSYLSLRLLEPLRILRRETDRKRICTRRKHAACGRAVYKRSRHRRSRIQLVAAQLGAVGYRSGIMPGNRGGRYLAHLKGDSSLHHRVIEGIGRSEDRRKCVLSGRKHIAPARSVSECSRAPMPWRSVEPDLVLCRDGCGPAKATSLTASS